MGNPGVATSPAIFCQFVFDITTFYDPNKKVDRELVARAKCSVMRWWRFRRQRRDL